MPRLVYILGITLLALWGSIQSANANNSATPTGEPVVLQLKWTHAFQFAGYYAAKEQGYYADAGLDVEIRASKPGGDSVEEVLSGRANFGVSDSSIVLQRAAGKSVIVLGVVFQHSAVVLLASDTGADQTIHDLAGKRVMLVPSDDELRAYLQKMGLPRGTYEEEQNSFSLDDLKSGTTDAFSAYSTDQTDFLDRDGFAYRAFSPRQAGIDFYGDNLFTSEGEISKNPDRVQAFRDASFRGWQYAMQNQEAIVDLILRRYAPEADREHLLYEAERMAALIRPVLVEMGYMSEGRWRHIADTYQELGMLPEDFAVGPLLYQEKKRDLRWLYRALALAAIGILLFGFIAFRFYRLSKALQADIAARKKAERENVELETQLQQAVKMQAIGTLAGGVAHDMNNVLAVVLGLGSVLYEEIEPNSPVREDIGDMIEAARRGQSMVANLLGFARKGNYVQQAWSPNEGIQQTANMLGKLIAKNVEIATKLHATQQVTADPSQLTTVLINLCVNAAHAIQEHGTITIATSDIQIQEDGQLPAGDYVKIEVQDDGQGMDAETLQQAFDPFFTTKEVGEGTGLGLSMVHGVIGNHGGCVTLTSEIGKGTVVSMLLPIRQCTANIEIPSCSELTQGNQTILVIDDELMIRKAIRRMLTKAGYEVLTAEGCQSAMEIVEDRRQHIDLVMLDLSMPKIGGAVCFERIHKSRPGLQVLICTGQGDPKDTEDMVANGACGVLLKPFVNDELYEAVSSALTSAA